MTRSAFLWVVVFAKGHPPEMVVLAETCGVQLVESQSETEIYRGTAREMIVVINVVFQGATM